MNKILNRNLNKVTKDTVYIVHKDWKDGSEKLSQRFIWTRTYLYLRRLIEVYVRLTLKMRGGTMMMFTHCITQGRQVLVIK